MTDNRRLPAYQAWFIEIARLIIGAQADGAGMCHGLSKMASQAGISRDLRTFMDRLYWMRYGPPAPVTTISDTEFGGFKLQVDKFIEKMNFGKALTAQALQHEKDKAHQLLHWIHFGHAQKDKIISPHELVEMIAIAKEIRGNAAKIIGQIPLFIASGSKTAASDKESKRQFNALKEQLLSQFDRRFPQYKKLIDIQIFIEAMGVYQSPNKPFYQNIYEKDKGPQFVSSRPVIPLLAPIALDTKSDEKATATVTSGIIELADITNMHTREKLDSLFKALEKLILDNQDALRKELETKEHELYELPFSFTSSSSAHSICFEYNFKTKKWIIIDAEHLPPYEAETKILSAIFSESFATQMKMMPNIALNSQISVASNAKTMIHVLQTWLASKEFAAAHSIEPITKSNPEILDDVSSGTTHLALACSHGDMTTVERLLNANADPHLVTERLPLAPVTLAIINGQQRVVDLIKKTELSRLKEQISHIELKNLYPARLAVIKNMTRASQDEKADYIALSCQFNAFRTIDPIATKLLESKSSYSGYFKTIVDQAYSKILSMKNANDGEVCTLDTAFWKLITTGNSEAVSSYIKAGIDFNQTNNDGLTPLQYAFAKGDVNMATMLLQAGAETESMNLITYFSLSPKGTSTQRAAQETIAKLIKDRQYQEYKQELALLTDNPAYPERKEAIDFFKSFGSDEKNIGLNYQRFQVFKLLDTQLQKLFDIIHFGHEIQEYYDEKADTSLADSLYESVSEAYGKITELDEKKAAFFARDFARNVIRRLKPEMELPTRFRVPTLIEAVKAGNRSQVKLLLEAKMNPHQTDSYGKSSLYYAIENGDIEMTKLLLQNDNDTDSPSNMVNASLFNLLYTKPYMQQCLRAYISHKAQLLITSLQTKPPFPFRQSKLNEFLAMSQQESDPIIVWLRLKLLIKIDNFARKMLSARASIDASTWALMTNLLNHLYNTALTADYTNYQTSRNAILLNFNHYIINNQLREVDMYLSTGYSFNQTIIDNPVIIAARGGNPTIMQKLINSGAQLQGLVGIEALITAVTMNHIDVARLLLKAGVNPDQTIAASNTALYVAVLVNNTAMCKLLLEAGADPNKVAILQNKSPITVARESGNQQMISIIEANLKQTHAPQLPRYSVPFGISKATKAKKASPVPKIEIGHKKKH